MSGKSASGDRRIYECHGCGDRVYAAGGLEIGCPCPDTDRLMADVAEAPK